MSNELIEAGELGALLDMEGQGKYSTEKALSEVTKVGDWFAYIQLMGGETKPVKRGEFPIGHFALHKSRKMIDLGSSFIFAVFAWRPKAMVFSNPPVSYFNPETDAFKQTEARGNIKNGGCGYGPEVLMWLPVQEEFATMFFGNKTGRNEAPNVTGLIKAKKYVGKLQSKIIETPEYTWHGPETKDYDLDIKMPPKELLLSELKKFNNPPESAQEIGEETEDDGRN